MRINHQYEWLPPFGVRRFIHAKDQMQFDSYTQAIYPCNRHTFQYSLSYVSQQWQWYNIDHSLKSHNTSHALWVTCWVHSSNTSKKTAHVITGPNCMERWHTNRNELETASKQIIQISNSFVMHLQIKAWFLYSQNTLWPTTHCTEGRSAYYGHQLKEHIPPQSWPSRAKQLRTNSKWKKMENITFKEFVTGWYLIQHIETLSK